MELPWDRAMRLVGDDEHFTLAASLREYDVWALGGSTDAPKAD